MGNIRKMVIIFPSVIERSDIIRIDPFGLDHYSFYNIQPSNQKETLLALHENQTEEKKNGTIRVFKDNAPQWNPKTNTYVYDFKGRVTQPSIKNF